MANLFFSLPVPAGDGVGASVDTAACGGPKTITVEGAFRGAVNIEVSTDGGVEWATIGTFLRPGKKILVFAANRVRVRRLRVPAISPGLPIVNMATDDNGGLFAVVPAAPGSVDTTLLGQLRTVILGEGLSGEVNIEISDDLVNWVTCMTMQGPDPVIQTKAFTSKYMRSTNAAAQISVGAINDCISITGDTNTDERVKTDGVDTVAEYLTDKLLVVGDITKTVVDKGAGNLAVQLEVMNTPLCDDDPENIHFDEPDPGLSPLAARCDHAHKILTGDPVTVRGDSNVKGTPGTGVPYANHQHRLELEVEDEGVLAGARPALNFIGAGVGAVDNPGMDRVDVTIPGNVTDGAVVERNQFVDPVGGSTTSSASYVDGMAGLNVPVPIDGDYWVIFESTAMNQNANAVLQIGISLNSLVAVVAGSERRSQGPAADLRPCITTVRINGLVAGDLIRALFRRISGSGNLTLFARNLTIIKVQ